MFANPAAAAFQEAAARPIVKSCFLHTQHLDRLVNREEGRKPLTPGRVLKERLNFALRELQTGVIHSAHREFREVFISPDCQELTRARLSETNVMRMGVERTRRTRLC